MKKRGHRRGKYRSIFESNVAKYLEYIGINYTFEEEYIEYEVPAKIKKYNPDFILENGIIVEAKGLLDLKDRQKHLLIKEQEPDLVIVFLFQNKNLTISKNSKTTYEDWCENNGFDYFQGTHIPQRWVDGQIVKNGILINIKDL